MLNLTKRHSSHPSSTEVKLHKLIRVDSNTVNTLNPYNINNYDIVIDNGKRTLHLNGNDNFEGKKEDPE